MTDPFDRFLGAALAPPARDPDASFVLRVRALVALDARLRTERNSLVHKILVQALGLASVAAGLAWLGRAGSVAAFFEASPAVALPALLAGFALLVMALPGSARAAA
jgi:hypothetical protein